MPDDNIRLLALDGGGIRGLSSLMILRRIMQTVDPDAPPRPCDYFDMIGGTSTGGLIAVMLGRLGMTVDECIEAYVSLSDRVFEKKSHRVNWKGKLQGRFDAAELERAVKDILAARELDKDALLKDVGASCKVFVCATSKQTGNIVCLTSYPSPRHDNSDLLASTTIWQACRATSAATSFFDPIAIGPFREEFVDGALGANNPVNQLWSEAQDVWGEQLPARLACLVSIGTGVPGLQPVQDDILGISATLLRLATETEKTAQQFHRDKSKLDDEGRYYRFNVDRGLDGIGLEESKRKHEIAAATRHYIESQTVFKQMKACVDRLAGRTRNRAFVSIPFCQDPDFVERGDMLERMGRICSQAPRRVALVGLGGVGKSQLAIEFAHRFSKTPTMANVWVFWMHAGTRTRVEEGFRTIADTIELAGREQPRANVPQLVSQWLSNERNGRWLIVLDSADDQDVLFGTVEEVEGVKDPPLATYLPQSSNGHIIITTRDKQLADRLIGKRDRSIEVGPMTEIEALALVKTKLGSYQDSDKKMAGDLVRALDLVPLAISQAAAHIQARSPRSSLEKYLDEFRKSERKRSKLLEHDAGDLRRYGGASNAVLTTWQISFDHIQSRRPSAANLLSLMSFFDRQGIPAWVLKGGSQANSVGSESDDESGSEAGSADNVFEDDLQTLRDYCLVTVNEKGSEFEMHSLVQLSTRKWLAAFGQQEKFQQLFVERMAAAFPTGVYENWTVCGPLFAHVQAALQHRPKDDRLDRWATLLYNGAWYAQDQGRYEVAENMASEARTARQQRLGKKNPATLGSTSQFASIISDRGRWDEAEKLQVGVTETFKAKLGPDHPKTLTSMNNLASTYMKQGRWKEAEKMQLEVMETRKTKLGLDHPGTLTSMGNLASTYWDQGRWEEAEKLQMEVMEARKTKLGPDHPDTLTSMNNLASTYSKQGRWDKAQKLQMEVIETRKTKLGPEHPSTLTSMANFASTYSNQGRWDKAEKLEVKVMEARKTKLGPDHPDTLASMANLAGTYMNQGRWDKAQKLQMEVMKTFKAKLGPDHPDTLTSMGNLALTYLNQGRWDKAEKLFVDVMEARKTKLGPDHPDTLLSMANLAGTYMKQGRWGEAEKLNMEVMETRRTKLGLDHPDTLTSMTNLASTYSNQGRWDEAEKLNVEVMETCKTKLGPDHPHTLASMNNLAYTWKRIGKVTDAVALMESCVVACQRILRADHPHTLSSMATLERWKG